ncbi:hypothetical protein F3Y22_tig00110319pilonHSYRG00490 [Hibiscus syriacus]|uniref:Uncharacterized protein n=1 Tax=Hibiscus syriacus TaxID=106335 RepID=A0A6A3B5B8_HIBSY|nr:hypothetical protein F3Y22_tig00110319pilonHSYRG00490 [Hibiscus syriacus]
MSIQNYIILSVKKNFLTDRILKTTTESPKKNGTPVHRPFSPSFKVNHVSTYALLVENVLEVIADTVVVHEAAAPRIQMLTKGFWDVNNASISIDERT